mmetsp:Transcript_7364/g.13294  ORF Transcript_7364/g.13294 Transcript_7364/m.13294 type:complete len:245 (-) Transcript_7364:141-875(-)
MFWDKLKMFPSTDQRNVETSNLVQRTDKVHRNISTALHRILLCSSAIKIIPTERTDCEIMFTLRNENPFCQAAQEFETKNQVNTRSVLESKSVVDSGTGSHSESDSDSDTLNHSDLLGESNNEMNLQKSIDDESESSSSSFVSVPCYPVSNRDLRFYLSMNERASMKTGTSEGIFASEYLSHYEEQLESDWNQNLHHTRSNSSVTEQESEIHCESSMELDSECHHSVSTDTASFPSPESIAKAF